MKIQLTIFFATLLLHSTFSVADDVEISTRVVGGADVNSEGDFPWMVYVHSGNYLCGGSLIDENTVLTAAHCLYDSNDNEIMASNITVKIGEYDTSNSSVSEVGIRNTYIHSDYDPDTFQNDIALLILTNSDDSTDPIARASLTTTTDAVSNADDATILGWGSIVGYDSGETVTAILSDILQQAEIPIKTDAQCTSSYPSYYDSSVMLCAGTEGMDACQGDSGGPLIIYNGGAWEQIGIVSFGAGCASAEYPGVYTRLAAFDDWIENIVDGVTADSVLNFTQADVDQSETKSLVISNNSDTEVQVSYSLSDDSEFSFDNSTCATIDTGETCSLAITYLPSSSNSLSETTLNIESDIVDATPYTTTLSGTPLSYVKSSSSSGGGSTFFLLSLPLVFIRRYLKR